MQIISITDVEEKINLSDAFIFDVTSPEMHHRHRIPGSSYVQMPFTRSCLPEDNGATLIFYSIDAKCRQSRRAASHAAGYGYRNVYVMRAGINGWIYGNKPVESGLPSKRSVRMRLAKLKTG